MKRAIFHDHVWLPEATQHKELWFLELVNNFLMSQQIANKVCTVCNATMWPLSYKWYVITPCNKLYTFPINQMLHIGQNSSESEERGITKPVLPTADVKIGPSQPCTMYTKFGMAVAQTAPPSCLHLRRVPRWHNSRPNPNFKEKVTARKAPSHEASRNVNPKFINPWLFQIGSILSIRC
jgi:hypothetical protein